ncbi:E3 SUMO-protein ligase KIAA1586-like [Bufo gargarizans]|uniref:E3 SUMO-protein ligase KIAA1586-like n=2 Tax=Bufo gargarizans TaxID=30331 RepID=UPI001CF3B073|nr:E3 SUMO-protein ligase KIAA1586-like [Bufo gargarizans]
MTGCVQHYRFFRVIECIPRPTWQHSAYVIQVPGFGLLKITICYYYVLEEAYTVPAHTEDTSRFDQTFYYLKNINKMKRQATLFSFFDSSKKKKTIQSQELDLCVNDINNNVVANTEKDAVLNENTIYEIDHEVPMEQVDRHDIESVVGNDDGTVSDVLTVEEACTSTISCWSKKQFEYFSKLFPWIQVKNGKLGCNVCSKVRGSLGIEKAKACHVSEEWSNFLVKPSGTLKLIQQASVRKKIREHSVSKSHNKAEKLQNTAKIGILPTAMDRLNEKAIAATIHIFNIVYSLALNNKPMADIEGEVQLQKINGVDVGVGLHSRKTAITIIQHISSQIRKALFSKIASCKSKLCVIIDESSTVAQKSVLVIYIRCELSTHQDPVNVFVDLKELDSTTAEVITETLFNCLSENGFDKDYLQDNLIGFCSDGASAMLGSKSGVASRIVREFPNIVIWHCLSHRVQLALDDAINSVSQVNHFKMFLEKIYSIYHVSNKHQLELHNIAADLELEIVKIGRILGPRWVACSARAAKAVWRAYPALYKHFSNYKNFLGMKKKMENLCFLKDLALMIEILEELSLLSLALQDRDVSLVKADRLLCRCIRALKNLKENPGKHEVQIDTMIRTEPFKDIPFQVSAKNTGLPRAQLIQSVIDNMKSRLFSTANTRQMDSGTVVQNASRYKKLLSLFSLLEPNSWPSDLTLSPWPEGECQLRQLNELIKCNIPVNDFRDYIDNRYFSDCSLPPSIQQAKKIIRVIAVSSAEAERGFSIMNNIATHERSRLTVSNISHLMTIKILGKPISSWGPEIYVKSWLRRNHHTATDLRVKKKAAKQYDENSTAIWSLF